MSCSVSDLRDVVWNRFKHPPLLLPGDLWVQRQDPVPVTSWKHTQKKKPLNQSRTWCCFHVWYDISTDFIYFDAHFRFLYAQNSSCSFRSKFISVTWIKAHFWFWRWTELWIKESVHPKSERTTEFCFYPSGDLSLRVLSVWCLWCDVVWCVCWCTKVWVGLQVSLHGVDEVPAGQEDEHGSGHLQRLDVPEQSLHQLERRLLLVDLSHRALRLRRVLRSTDHITVSLQTGRALHSLIFCTQLWYFIFIVCFSHTEQQKHYLYLQ